MTSRANQPRIAPITPAQATILLDQVIYEQVVECIDLDALYKLELQLIMQLGDLGGIADDQIPVLAASMIDRALLRLPTDLRGYLDAAAWPMRDCELCEDEARAARAARKRAPPARLDS
jgi:hypothetical protein